MNVRGHEMINVRGNKSKTKALIHKCVLIRCFFFSLFDLDLNPTQDVFN